MNAPRRKVAVQQFAAQLYRNSPDTQVQIDTLRAVQLRCDVSDPDMAQFLEDVIVLLEAGPVQAP